MNKEWWDEFWRDPLVAHYERQNIPKAFIDAFQDEDAKDKFRRVVKSAEEFAKSIADCFKKAKE